MKLGHWKCDIDIPDEKFGFVYVITNLRNNRKYIGKKQCVAIKKLPPLKGKKRRRTKKTESDWMNYTGSCRELNDEILQYGEEDFRFDILKWCCSKSELAYFEAKLQFEEDVLLKDEYYNGIINTRIGRVKLSEE